MIFEAGRRVLVATPVAVSGAPAPARASERGRSRLPAGQAARPRPGRSRAEWWWLCGVAAASLLLTGCQAKDPALPVLDSSTDFLSRPDLPQGCPQPPVLAAPLLDVYANPTSLMKPPFRGQAPGAATVLTQGGAGSATGKVGSDGRFCVEVPLHADSKNTVVFTPIDAQGCWGIGTTIHVVHQSSAPAPDAGPSGPVNVALGQAVSSKDTPKGSLASVVDGDDSTFVEVSFWDPDLWGAPCDAFTWIAIDLGKTYSVSKVVIKWPPGVGKEYAACYSVLLSALAAPPDPDPAQASAWTTFAEMAGTSVTQTVATGGLGARWVALLLYENDSAGLWETFKVAEIEVWGVDPSAVTPQPPDKCQ